jgi:AcrR family transcriptional regulator
MPGTRTASGHPCQLRHANSPGTAWAARVDRIAARAKTNKRMLYYYFGNKDALFSRVLESAYARIRAAVDQLSLLDVEPVESVRRLVEFTWNYYLAHPEFYAAEQREPASRPSPEAIARLRAMNSPVIETLASVLARARAGRAIPRRRRRAAALHLHRGLSYFYLATITRCRLSSDGSRGHARPAGAPRTLTDVVLGYLRAPAVTARRAPAIINHPGY